MRIDRQFKPDLIVSQDETREHLHNAYLDVVHERVYATDGHRLVSLPVAVSSDEKSGPIAPEVLKQARKEARGPSPQSAHIDCTTERPSVNFPDLNRVLPTEMPQAIIALNAKSLFELAQAMGQKDHMVAIAINFHDLSKPMIVYTTNDCGSDVRSHRTSEAPFALLMQGNLFDRADVPRPKEEEDNARQQRLARELFATVRGRLQDLHDALRAGDVTASYDLDREYDGLQQLACGIQRQAIELALATLPERRQQLRELIPLHETPADAGAALDLDALENAIVLFTPTGDVR